MITRDSIAWEAAAPCPGGRRGDRADELRPARRLTERAAKSLPQPADVLELDVNDPEHLDGGRGELQTAGAASTASCTRSRSRPRTRSAVASWTRRAESAITAFQTSAFSLKALGAALADLYPEEGASIVGMDFDASVAWPVYDWMGVAKAALEATARYLARDLGPRGVRVNLVAAGPLGTVAARGIPGFEELAEMWSKQAPIGWNGEDAGPVADAVLFLLSDLARGITGEIMHVDGGFHAMGAPMTAARGRARRRRSAMTQRPFRRLAIVNRGEAAMRAIRAVRELNWERDEPIRIIALHIEAERHALFVRQADERHCLGEGGYLDYDGSSGR